MKQKTSPLEVVASPAALPSTPQLPESTPVTLSMSEADRWFAATALYVMPWKGGEKIVLGLSAIHSALKLFDIPRDKPYGKCRVALHAYTLSLFQIELLIAVLCSTGFKGEAGPSLVKVVSRLREAVTKTKG